RGGGVGSERTPIGRCALVRSCRAGLGERQLGDDRLVESGSRSWLARGRLAEALGGGRGPGRPAGTRAGRLCRGAARLGGRGARRRGGGRGARPRSPSGYTRGSAMSGARSTGVPGASSAGRAATRRGRAARLVV